jgi:inner membrane protease ATP23
LAASAHTPSHAYCLAATLTPPALTTAATLAAGAPVRFMLDAMRKAGCAVDKRFFSVETCDQAVVGGFRPPDGVRLAQRAHRQSASTPRCAEHTHTHTHARCHVTRARVRHAQVVMCHNHMQSATEFENMLVHELVHAFDHCRGADLSWSNCRHHACSEARCVACVACAVGSPR